MIPICNDGEEGLRQAEEEVRRCVYLVGNVQCILVGREGDERLLLAIRAVCIHTYIHCLATSILLPPVTR